MTLLHGIASRNDLPLPFELVVAGGALVLLLTFWVAFFAWRRPKYEEERGTELPRLSRLVDSRWVAWPVRIVVAAGWSLMAVALFAGVDRIDNPAVGFIYVLLWVGLVPTALLFGNVYRRANPLRLLTPREPEDGNHSGASTSLVPAAAALAVFAYLELVQPGSATLPVLRIFVVAALLWVVGGAYLKRGWVARADPFEVYSTVVARMSPWARSQRGLVMLTNPLRNLASWRAPRGLALVACVLLGSTLFDALSNTALWVRSTQQLGGLLWPVSTVAIIASMALVYLLFWLGTRPYRRLSMDQMAPGLVPLVVAYALSHYATMLYLEGQRTLIRANDPLGRGWNLFGFIEAAPSTALFAYPTAIAVAQVVLIVGGHALGVLVTHDIALRAAPSRARSHLPLLGIMVVFTVGGLLLMFGG